MKKRGFLEKNSVKKVVSMACISAMLVAGVPSGRAYAEEAVSDQFTSSGQEETALVPAAEDCMQKIYENLIKEGSGFTKNQKDMEEMVGDQLVYDASISGNTITVTVTGKDYYAESSGSWDYVLEGDYLTYVPKVGDYQGEAYLVYLIEAAADYLGMDSDLVNGYVFAVGTKNLESRYYIMDKDAEGIVTKYRLYVGGAYEMDEVLNSVYLDQDVIGYFGELEEHDSNLVAHIGKLEMYAYGKRTSVDIYIGEHEDLTELAYKSVLETVGIMKPVGYETFLENYKELSEVSTDTYQVSYISDASELPDAFQGEEHYKFIKLHFSVPALSASSLTMQAGEFDFLRGEDCEVTGWSSSNKKVAAVEDGQITALKKGTATITATLSDGKKLTCEVNVTSSPSMTVGGKAYKKNKTYTVKKNKTIKAVIAGKAAMVDNTYTSSKPKIAKINSNGMTETVKIKGIKKGTSKITIKVNGVNFTFKVKVK